ncbi:histone-like protein 18C isoform X2 [Drosophila gunungcola]|uniref:histone-like protein 18C isoform X2 n=1 Tax=Drosophila gunungcola TaxID=103775 RepID=UPI0022E0FADA|nr:histone-like protein 18C isoform X2 [Drosophila gunungcola]
MSSLQLKDSKTAVKTENTKKTLEEHLMEADGLTFDFDNAPIINFLKEFWYSNKDYYTDSQIAVAAVKRWNDMSVGDRCQYAGSPPIAIRGDTDCSSTSTIKLPSSANSDDQMESEPGTSKATDAFFVNSDDECQRREPKCVKPRKRCAKPRTMSKVKRKCAKPKPKCARAKPACPRPRKKMDCSKPMARCPKAKPACPKPRCSK